jgi:hypothetical protein
VLAAYGADLDAADLLDAVVAWQDRCWRGIEQEAAEGDAARRALVDDGTALAIRVAAEWTAAHASRLAAAAG